MRIGQRPTIYGASADLEKRFDPKEFLLMKMRETADLLRGSKVLLACSGGVCSNVMAAIFQKAGAGSRVIPVLVDTGFMREREAVNAQETLTRAPLKLNLTVVEERKQFMKGIERCETPIDKVRSFQKMFYKTLTSISEKEDAEVIALGTSATVKTALSQMPGVPSTEESLPRKSIKIVEPFASLSRHEVAHLAQTLELPPRLAEIAHFPFMGLSIRTIGKMNDEKLRVVRDATKVVEEELQYVKPTQYFAAAFDNKDDDYERKEQVKERISDLLDVGPNQVDLRIPLTRVTGLVGGRRVYLRACAVRVTLLGSKEIFEPDYDDLTNLAVEFTQKYKQFARCLYGVTTKPKNGKYIVVIRAVSTEDFSEARIAKLEWSKLYSIAERVMRECGKVSSVYYDVTAKPPATVEFE